MKRILLLLLSLIIIAGLCACSNESSKDSDLIITVDSDAAKQGVAISEDEDGSDPAIKLYAASVDNVTNITYDWLPATLDMEAYGSHNGKNYMAYTFRLSNNGNETVDYHSVLHAVRAEKSADEAVRIMVYRNSEPTVYAKENQGLTTDDGSPEPFETIYKKVIPADYHAPTKEEIESAAEIQNKEPVEVTDEPLAINPWVDDRTVFSNDREGLAPGETDKYTIVLWIEGVDPDCSDEIREGSVKLAWYFSLVDEEL